MEEEAGVLFFRTRYARIKGGAVNVRLFEAGKTTIAKTILTKTPFAPRLKSRSLEMLLGPCDYGLKFTCYFSMRYEELCRSKTFRSVMYISSAKWHLLPLLHLSLNRYVCPWQHLQFRQPLPCPQGIPLARTWTAFSSCICTFLLTCEFVHSDRP